MNTVEKGDLAEYTIIAKALKNGWGVSKPIGRPPYDLIFDVKGTLVKVQIKMAWYEKKNDFYSVDVRKTKTNRKTMVRSFYKDTDFNFAICYIAEKDVSYIMPIEEFLTYKGKVTFVLSEQRQRRPKSDKFKEAWDLIENYCVVNNNSSTNLQICSSSG